MPTRTTRDTEALAVPAACWSCYKAGLGKAAVRQRAQTARNETALVARQPAQQRPAGG